MVSHLQPENQHEDDCSLIHFILFQGKNIKNTKINQLKMMVFQRSPLKVEESVEQQRETHPPSIHDSDSSGVEYESATDNEETLVVNDSDEEEARGDAPLEDLIRLSDTSEPDQV